MISDEFDKNYKVNVSHATMDYLFQSIRARDNEIERLNKRIDKAIKQCEQDVKDIWKWEGAYMGMFEEIADILKGSDKE